MAIHWLVVLFYGTSTLFRSFNAEFKFQTIQFISIVFVYKQLNVKTVLLQAIQFSISTHFSCIWPIERTLSGANTPSQSGPGSDSSEGILRIPQRSGITGTSPSDCLMSYPRHSLRGVGENYPSAEMQSVYSTAPAKWAYFSLLCHKLFSNPYNICICSDVCMCTHLYI